MFATLTRHSVKLFSRSLTVRGRGSRHLSVNTDWSKVWTNSFSSRGAPAEGGIENVLNDWKDFICATDPETEQIIAKDMLIHQDFITEEEERSLFNEIEPYLKRLRYEVDHWDDAIRGYRETERKHWQQNNKVIIQRMKELAFSPTDTILPYVHILDLQKSGCVKPHVDSIRFCGTTLSGMCLLSSSVMRLVCEKDKSCYADVLLKRCSLYIMRGRARYEYTHEILPEETSVFRGQVVPRERRISIICRNEPPLDDSDDDTDSI